MGLSKSQQVHHKASIYLYFMLCNQIELLNQEIIEPFLKQAITSASPESRQTGRRAFLIWQ